MSLDLPLFGDDYPAPAPRKGAPGYLTWLAQLDWPNGWQFWALAGAFGRSEPGCEWVVLVRDRQLREACVDLCTGAVTKWGERL